MEKNIVYSKYLAKNVELVMQETTESGGQPILLITHESLTNIVDDIQPEIGLKYVLSEPFFTRDRIIYHCRITDKFGKDITEVGESCYKTLNTQIAQNYAATMAAKRAFDAAVIRFLQLDVPKAYSAETDIPRMEETPQPEVGEAVQTEPVPQEAPEAPTAAPVVEQPKTTPAPAEAITSEELPQSEEEVHFVDVEPMPETATIMPEPTEAPKPAQTAAAQTNAPTASETLAPEAPAPAVTEAIATFGKHKGKKMSEIFQIDRGWVEWVAEKVNPTTAEKKAVVEAAKVLLGK